MQEMMASPEVVAIVIALAGVILAYFLSRGSVVALAVVERWVHRFIPQNESALTIQNNEATVSRVVFYLVLSFFLLLALKFLGFSLVNELLDLVIVYIPKLLLGAVIILVGYVLGLLAKSTIENLTDGTAGRVLPTLTQYLVVITAIVTGLGQMEIDVSFIATLLFILIATVLGSLSISFALGSQNLVANMLARREISHFVIGDELKVDGVEGVVKEMTKTGITLETAEGDVYVPAALLTQQLVLKKSGQAQ